MYVAMYLPNFVFVGFDFAENTVMDPLRKSALKLLGLPADKHKFVKGEMESEDGSGTYSFVHMYM